jgi:predicted RNA binding protein YcfA (HicA-like mRNA interferase family)
MTDYTRAIRKYLRESGWEFHRHAKGDHEIWIHRPTQAKVTVDSKVRGRALANRILKDAGIGKKF